MPEKTTSGQLLIYGDIGASFWGDGITAKSVSEDLQKIGAVDLITVRISSMGGNAFEGIAIYNQLARSKSRIEVDIDGGALSIASVIAMAGKEIRMAENAMMMLHDPWTFAMGNGDDLRKTADLLDQMKGNLVTTYNRRTKIGRDEIADLMAEETFMSAEDAKERGFIDKITEGVKAENRLKITPIQASRFRNPPKELLAPAERVHDIAARAAVASIAESAARLKIASIVERSRQLQL